MTRGIKPRPMLERFEEKVVPEPMSGCWLWTGWVNNRGYGMFTVAPQTHKLAHRISYECHVGPIPEGLVIDHLCRTRACVNPAHLECVTMRENTLRGEGLSAQRARQTHCQHGHEFTTENTYRRPDGRRLCNTCRRAYQRGRQ